MKKGLRRNLRLYTSMQAAKTLDLMKKGLRHHRLVRELWSVVAKTLDLMKKGLRHGYFLCIAFCAGPKP